MEAQGNGGVLTGDRGANGLHLLGHLLPNPRDPEEHGWLDSLETLGDCPELEVVRPCEGDGGVAFADVRCVTAVLAGGHHHRADDVDHHAGDVRERKVREDALLVVLLAVDILAVAAGGREQSDRVDLRAPQNTQSAFAVHQLTEKSTQADAC